MFSSCSNIDDDHVLIVSMQQFPQHYGVFKDHEEIRQGMSMYMLARFLHHIFSILLMCLALLIMFRSHQETHQNLT